MIRKFWTQHTTLVIGTISSIILLSIFMIFEYCQSDILKLESRWIIVAGVPLLSALIVGGYIKSFKGFGVELEGRLSKPVTNLDLSATTAMEEIHGEKKQDVEYLHKLREIDKRRINRLVLIEGRQNYYFSSVLERYLDKLKNLKYIEIRNLNRKFVALIPVRKFINDRGIDNILLGDFIHRLEQSQVLQHYYSSLITEHVTEDANLIDSLKTMRRKKIQKLIVIDADGIFLGILTIRAIEKRIVNDVLAAKENA